MQYRIDPITGNKLSALGFGCMRFPRNITIDVNATEKLVLQAIELGVNYFDTAYIYLGSEQALGEVIKRNPQIREQMYIATKLPHTQCKTYEDFDRIFLEQLSRLNITYVDYYLIHNLPDIKAWNRVVELGIEQWIIAKKKSGQIKSIGFSFHGTQSSYLEILNAYPWEFTQIQYNYMNENYQAGRVGLEKAYEMGIPVIIMEPLLGGKLANGLPKRAERLLQNLNPKKSPASWALSWLLNQKQVTLLLSGMNRMDQVMDNIQTCNETQVDSMTDQELQAIESVKRFIEESYKVPCTGCEYCLPCPFAVNIPGCFASYNARFANGLVTGMGQYFTSTNALHSKNNTRAARCTQCGVCVKKCPQHILIPEELTKVRKKMEPFYIRLVMKLVSRG